MTLTFETGQHWASLRIGSREVFIEREPEWAPDAWFKVVRPQPGELGLSLGRWAVLAVNHAAAAA